MEILFILFTNTFMKSGINFFCVFTSGNKVIYRDFGMGGDTSPPFGGTHGQGSDEGGLARDSRQNLEVSQISNECE